MPPKFSRDEVVSYLQKKRDDYQEWWRQAVADGNVRSAAVFHEKDLTVRTILADIAAMEVDDGNGDR